MHPALAIVPFTLPSLSEDPDKISVGAGVLSPSKELEYLLSEVSVLVG